MTTSVAIAVETLDSAYGNQTAHLTRKEQIEVALELVRRLTETAGGIVEEELVDPDEA